MDGTDVSPRELVIGGLCLPSPLVLAPMAGVTDRYFRGIVRRIGGVGLVTMEFISSKMLVQGERRTLELLQFDDAERPLSIQIYGSDVATMVEAAREVAALEPDACDINMGCPANKVLKGCAGAALMGDLPLATEIIREVRKVVPMPLTVKFRVGLNDRRRSYLELGRICEGEGIDAVALHGRTARQRFTGEADWSTIARLKQEISIPVLGNGDILTADDALSMLAETGCDGVLVGRGATRNPWIFRQIAARLAGSTWPDPTLEERRALILDHFEAVIAGDEPKLALHRLRNFTGWYSRGLPDGLELRRQIQKQPDAPALRDEVERFLDRKICEADSQAAA